MKRREGKDNREKKKKARERERERERVVVVRCGGWWWSGVKGFLYITIVFLAASSRVARF